MSVPFRANAEIAPARPRENSADNAAANLRDELPPSESPAGSLPGNQVLRGDE